jgi:8-oxo-dGTP pyrophosphatase MutT (NUDIX family)
MAFLKKYFYIISRALWLLLKPLSFGVRILMVRNRKILLVMHVYQDHWFLPGGLIERGESVEAAVRREVAEEVGATLFDLSLYGVFTNFEYGKSDHVIVFISRDFSLNGHSDDEIERLAFFDMDNLPDGVSPGSKRQIERYINGDGPAFGLWRDRN